MRPLQVSDQPVYVGLLYAMSLRALFASPPVYMQPALKM
jgi:hypothetical protein